MFDLLEFLATLSQATSISMSKWPMLQTIASSFIWSRCAAEDHSQQPVAVTKMLPRGAASSIVTTW